MDEIDEGNLHLNISTETIKSGSKPRKEKPRGNRGQRIKARRKAKVQNANVSGESDVQDDKTEESDQLEELGEKHERNQRNNQQHKEENVRLRNEGTSSKVYISSLFRFNPDIPKVQSSSVQPIKEKVFSSASFEALNLHPFMLSNLNKNMNLDKMTSVQQLAIPPILEGRDVMVKSQTGSGKTLVFAVPIIQTLQGLSPRIQRADGAYALIVVPTRELALQCYDTFQKLVGPFRWIVPGCLMGGEKKKSEKARLRKGINILIATPGRLTDHMESTQSLRLDKIKWLIIDEADRLLDLGYEKDVAKIMNNLNTQQTQERQTVLLSATLSEGVERLAGMSLNNPVRIDVTQNTTEIEQSKGDNSIDIHKQEKDRFTVPEKLKQHFIITPCKLRLVTLAAFIIWKCKIIQKSSKMIIFLSTQDSVEFNYSLFQHFFGVKKHSDDLYDNEETSDINIYRLHGDLPQKERTTIYQTFCEATAGILLCTDVAARGLHLPKVKWIVQYTTPGGITEYVHRVGRTARAGSQGNSLLFLMPSEVEYIKLLNEQQISLEELDMGKVLKMLTPVVSELVDVSGTERERPRTSEEAATYLQMSFENFVHKNTDMHQLAIKAYQSFVRAYATYPANLKHIFHIKHLHLGHLAKSFGLRDAPGTITSDWKHAQTLKRKRSSERSSAHSGNFKKIKLPKDGYRNVSEFSSGLAQGKMSKFNKKKKMKVKR